MLEYDFEDSIIYWAVTTARALESALNEELEPLGITYRQAQVLAWLALEGELTQTQLCERLRVEAPTLAGILDRMERDGWIGRFPAPHDRRKKFVRPTPRVKPVWDRIAAAGRRVRARATEGLRPEEVQRLMHDLGRIQDNLKALVPAGKALST